MACGGTRKEEEEGEVRNGECSVERREKVLEEGMLRRSGKNSRRRRNWR